VEIEYLEQVEAAIAQMDKYQTLEGSAQEIREELIQQRYLEKIQDIVAAVLPRHQVRTFSVTTSSDFEVLIGRNNRQNDQLLSSGWDYDPLVPLKKFQGAMYYYV